MGQRLGALETLVEFGLGNFDGDGAVEAGVIGLVNVTHPSRADGREDFIGAEFVAGRERHLIDKA